MLTNTEEKQKPLPLFAEEEKCLQFLKEQQPQLVAHYLNSIPVGRRGMLFKLAASFLRENIIELYSSSITMKKIGNVLAMGLEELNENWETLLRQLQQKSLLEDITYRLYFFDQRLLVFPIAKEYAYGRIMLVDDIVFVTDKGVKKVETASEFLTILKDKLPEQVNILQNELENGTANYSLALAYFEQWKKEIKKEAAAMKAHTMLDYAVLKKDQEPNWSQALFFEQLATEGHHLHPGAKTKTGMEPKDVYQFSPEFRQTQFICFVAVRKDHLLQTEIEPNYIESAFPDIHECAKKTLDEKGFNGENYRLLPVHEWQYNHSLTAIYEKEIKAGIIVLLDGINIDGGASSSFRTIFPKQSNMPSLKLAVNSQMTSTIRSISPQTAMNSLEFSKMMKKILDKEPSLESFCPINEVAGYSFRSTNTDKARNLTVVIRENLETQLDRDELAIPGCSLYNTSPISGKVLLIELVERYCSACKFNIKEGTVSFLKDYLSIVIPGYLILMVKYGVALEGHLQNSVPVFKNGKPVRFFFRDWGGARIHQERLKRQGITINFHRESVSITDNEQEMRNKAYYTIFQNHIGEMIVQLSQASKVREEELWNEVKKACDKSFTALQGQGCDWAKEDADCLYTPYIDHKALTKMRLHPNAGYSYSSVVNPLKGKEERKWQD